MSPPLTSVIVGMALVATLGACSDKSSDSKPASGTSEAMSRPIPRPATNRQQQLVWLQCIECSSGELARVAALGKSDSGSATVDSLRQDLYLGPSAPRRMNILRQFDATYTEDSLDLAEEGNSPMLTREQYVAPMLDNFVTTYRVRAARALGAIGGPAAKAALDTVLSRPVMTHVNNLRPQARRAIAESARDAARP